MTFEVDKDFGIQDHFALDYAYHRCQKYLFEASLQAQSSQSRGPRYMGLLFIKVLGVIVMILLLQFAFRLSL